MGDSGNINEAIGHLMSVARSDPVAHQIHVKVAEFRLTTAQFGPRHSATAHRRGQAAAALAACEGGGLSAHPWQVCCPFSSIDTDKPRSVRRDKTTDKAAVADINAKLAKLSPASKSRLPAAP